MPARILKGTLLLGLALALGGTAGYWLAGQRHGAMPTQAAAPAAPGEKAVLYWYDPMYPQQKFDQPGKSPFMDMDLVPRYADDAGDSAALSIDPRVTQNLGMRLATVSRGSLAGELELVGSLTFDDRAVALVQARSGGFVERVYRRANEDLLAAGDPLADLLVPEWSAAQEEFLALRTVGDAGLLAAARQRLRLAGMPAELIARVERSGRVQPSWTLTSPIAGVLRELEVREGMTLGTGATLARINGLERVWLEVAVPEAEASGLGAGQGVEVRLPAFPGQVQAARIDAVLPQANLDSRTLRLRIELDNPQGRLRPGMTAQVRLQRAGEPDTLLLPNEAVIRTGRRALVMLAEAEGRYRPVEVRLGRESTAQVEVVQGLEAGQQVVASGQFLLDSEASLRGLPAQALDAPSAQAAPALHEAEGRIERIEARALTISHGPFRTLGMPGMTMRFPLAEAALARGLRVGDRVRFAVGESDEGLRIERLEQLEVQP
ncbi:efflux RND transporter periplasmic adaptor subunit [Pseudomonas benzenivorans]|uniref:Efflux RND transporter periplasmic adaptor subunit n=1 Tax=Pseudomonas benzenivorans TaxID=556533 RepID=A0ABZ0Q0T7_9PSED|nr:efflux RND transporter periplasmic adaptor subunit [Pseudomonas benzenivorans]WPC06816.1 efflux RND transporter periplasmic adaptor subunit [Pseudomonas benzenivorans]